MQEPLRAHCYCGGVEWQVGFSATGRALFCHCQSCRRAHSAPLYHVCYVAAHEFQVTKGADLVRTYGHARPETFSRSFCSICGTRTHNNLKKDGVAVIGVFPSTFEDPKHALFEAKVHLHAAEAVLDLDTCFNDSIVRLPGDAPPKAPPG